MTPFQMLAFQIKYDLQHMIIDTQRLLCCENQEEASEVLKQTVIQMKLLQEKYEAVLQVAQY